MIKQKENKEEYEIFKQFCQLVVNIVTREFQSEESIYKKDNERKHNFTYKKQVGPD